MALQNMSVNSYVGASQQKEISIEQLKETHVTILAVHDDCLLISYWESQKVFFYSFDGKPLGETYIPNSKLYDVTGTRDGNIVYTDKGSEHVVLVSRSGEIIVQTKLPKPRYLYAHSDGTIYVTSMENGVFQSKDNGKTWRLLFKPTDGWMCLQAIRVMPKENDSAEQVFWTRGYTDDNWRMRMYKISGKTITWQEVAMEQASINLLYCRLEYDGRNTMIVADLPNNSVHTWSIDGTYGGQLITAEQVHKPCRPAVDKKTGLLYLGTWDKVGVYSLTYEDAVVNK